MDQIEFTNKAFNVEGMIGVKIELLDQIIISLAQICSNKWTVKEAQMIIDESQRLKDNEIYDYVVPGTELTISIDKDYYFLIGEHLRKRKILAGLLKNLLILWKHSKILFLKTVKQTNE